MPANEDASPDGAPQAEGGLSRNNSYSLLLRLLRFGLAHRWACAVMVGLQLVLIAFSLTTLGLTGVGLDYLRSQVQPRIAPPQWPLQWQPPTSWAPRTTIAGLAALVLLVAVLTALLRTGAAVASAALSQQILLRLRTDIYAKLQQLSFHFYDAADSSSLINRAAGDANAVRNFVDGVVVKLLTVALTLTVYLVYMLRVHVTLTLICLATTPLLYCGAVWFSRRSQPAYRRASEAADRLVRRLVENVQGMHVVKGFACQRQQIQCFADANREVRREKESIFFLVSTFQPAMGLLTQINMLVLLGYGGMLVIRGQLQLGAGLFVFANLLQEFANQVGQLTNVANTIQSSLVSAERVFEVLDAPITIRSCPAAVTLKEPQGRIEFRHVSFGYTRQHPVLRQVSFIVPPGLCLGITGETGAGKSTLLSLLCRFYDPDEGQILIDGIDVRELELVSLRRAIGLVFQESFLFSNSIRANIAFGHTAATYEQVEQAARDAAADDFICRLPDGYDTIVGEHGANLSGGQRQRLALARALVTDPAILLLDDATAAVDPETESGIHAALSAVRRQRTTLLVSSRVSTLRRADRILVLEEGRILAVGAHAELIKECPFYRRLAESQFAESLDQEPTTVSASICGERFLAKPHTNRMSA